MACKSANRILSGQMYSTVFLQLKSKKFKNKYPKSRYQSHSNTNHRKPATQAQCTLFVFHRTQKMPDPMLQNGVPGCNHHKMTRTSKCNERCGMDIFGFMGFYGPAWSLKQASDFLASKNRASIGGCAPSFCKSLMALAIL